MGMSRDERKAMELIRVRAVTQVLNGVPVIEVARALGFSKVAVHSWVRTYNSGGMNALRSRRAHGAPPKLSAYQMATLRTLIVGVDPRQLRLPFALWTRDLIA